MGLTITLLTSASLAASTPSPAVVQVSTGLPGPQGPQGPSGAAATIAIGSVSSVPYGTAPTVNNSGTSSAAVFNFQLETGPQGIQGPQGVQGQTGPGVPTGGSASQVLAKIDGTNYNTHWVAAVTSVAGRTGAVTLSTSDISGMSSYATTSFVTSQGYITASALTPYLTISSAQHTYLAGSSGSPTTAGSAFIYPATGLFDYATYLGNGVQFFVNDLYKYGIDQNGVKFYDGSVQTSAGISSAPNDGNYYIQQNGGWVQLIVS